MDGSARYRAFISYSHRDAKWAEWLHRKLETYRLPRALVGRESPFGPIPERLQPIFRDRDELGTAMDLSTEITAALQDSLFLIVLCSPAAAASRWVNEEVRSFKRMHGEGRVRAIILDGEPFSGEPATECFPESLRFRVGVDGIVSDVPAEPMAADLRRNPQSRAPTPFSQGDGDRSCGRSRSVRTKHLQRHQQQMMRATSEIVAQAR